MMLEGKSLCIILGTGPASATTRIAYRIAKSAIELKCGSVRIFMWDNGIYNALKADSTRSILPELHALKEKGVEFVCCTNMAKARGVSADNASDVVGLESLYSFNDMITNSERVVFFGPVQY